MLRILLNHGGHIDFSNLIAHPNVTFAPRVGSSQSINHESCILSTFDLDNWLQLITTRGILNELRRISRLIVSKTELPINVEAPGEENALVGEGRHMAETSSALNKVFPFV